MCVCVWHTDRDAVVATAQVIFRKVVGVLRRPGYFFVLIAAILGFVVLALVPPLQVPDEIGHFSRAYALSELNFRQDNLSTGSGAHLPTAIGQFEEMVSRDNLPNLYTAKYTPDTARRAMAIRVTPERTDRMFVNLAAYSPVAYVPQATGIAVARLFTSRIGVMFYAARICNLLFFVGLCYAAIRLIPVGKWLIAAVLVSPMVVFLAGSLSADVSVFVYTTLLIAITMYLWTRTPPQIQTRWWVILGIVACVLALSKQAYIVFVPFVALLLVRRTKQFRWRTSQLYASRILPVLLVFLSVVVAYIGWTYVNQSTDADTSLIQRANGFAVNPEEQLRKVTSDPLYAVSTVASTAVGQASDETFQSMFGSFGRLNVNLPMWAIGMYVVVLLLFVGYVSQANASLLVQQRTLALIIAGVLVAVCSLGIFVSLLLVWTPVGAESVAGIQGRYFIPCLLLLAPGVVGVYRHTLRLRYLILPMTIVHLSMCILLIDRYYGFFT